MALIGRLKLSDYRVGDKVKLNCCEYYNSSPQCIYVRKFIIHAILPNFIVLDTGKYKICTSKHDFSRGYCYGIGGGYKL